MRTAQDFTKGKILSPLIGFALPILFAVFLQTMYGAVDLLIVGQFSTVAEVSAVSTGSWIMTLVTSAITGLAMGTTILLGRKIGEGRAEEGGRVIGASIVLFAVVGAVITVLALVFAPQLALAMHAPKEAFSATVAYIRICAAGTVFIIGYNVLGSIFRGMGNARLPLISVAIACVFNIVGDLLLVAVIPLGAAGAAIATVAAQAASVLISMLIIRRQRLPFVFNRRALRADGVFIRETVRLGLPIALQDVLVGISFLVITAIANSIGLIESAGVGIAEKVCGFVLLVPSAYMQAMSAFVAQNMGAARLDRAKRALFYAIGTSLAVGLFLSYFTFFHGDLLAGIFAHEAAVLAAAAEYLKAYAIDCLLVSFLFCFIGYFNGRGNTTFVMAQGIIGAFCVRIPVSFAMSRATPVSLFHLGLATPCSTVVQILLCLAFFARMERKDRAALQTQRKS